MKPKHILFIACFIPLLSFGQIDLQKKGSLTVVMEPGVENLLETYHRKNGERMELAGYRVQIFNGKKAQMMDARSEFLALFPNVPVYNLYESPEYKVQVGDFRTRLEAERFLKQVIATYGSGFVVKTKIKFPQLYYPVAQ